MACWGRSTVCSPSAPLDFGFSLEAYGCSGVVFIVVFRALAEGRDVEGRVDAEGGGRTEVSSSVGPREKPASPTGTACHPDAMASNGSFPGPPGDGWQQRTLPMLAGLAAEDARISCLRVHGSASGTAASADRWSDLDLMITTTEPAVEAEDFARQIGRRLSPVFAASRSGNSSSYCVRLVLRDVRRIDVTGDAWASQLARAPAPYSRTGITAAIRSYTTMLTDIAANWDPPPQRDHSPPLELLDAVSSA
jgi:Streptomycin adenylyltransferase